MAQILTPPAPREIVPLLALATEMLKSGRPADAIAPLREAALLQPSNTVIQHDLGLACLEVGYIPDAIAALQEAVALNPRYGDAHFRIGIALENQGDIVGAIVAYERATELQPSLAEAWFRAGALVYTLGHRDEAIGCFRRASATGGKSSFGRIGKARALLTEERNQEAELVLRKTILQEPDNAMAHELLGSLLAEFGRFDEARECFQRTVNIAPRLAGSYYDLVRCRPITASDDDLLDEMKGALDTPGLEAAQRQRLYLAIGKAKDDVGDYAAAMEHFDAADEIRRASAPFDATAFSREINRLIARCTPTWLARARQFGSADATPVLIMGMPRSGTTLVEQIVSMHPDAAAGDELNFWNERGAMWHSSGADEQSFFVRAAIDYLGVLRTVARRATRVTDKMPFNFLWAGVIHATFPGAIIIHCRRAAVDTALSIHQTYFHSGLAFPTGGKELVEYFRGYQRLTDHWRKVLPADRFIDVDYEELTRAPEPVIRRIIAACGLSWNNACLCPELNPRAVRTPSKWQARQPIYQSSVARWKRYEPWLGPLRALIDDVPETISA